jgi:hypothetical protein
MRTNGNVFTVLDFFKARLALQNLIDLRVKDGQITYIYVTYRLISRIFNDTKQILLASNDDEWGERLVVQRFSSYRQQWNNAKCHSTAA